MNDDVCCPVFDPKPWDKTMHTWSEKVFLKTTVAQVFHMPLPGIYGKTITKLWEDAQKNGIAPEQNDFLLLSHDCSPWKQELFLSVTADKPGLPTVKMSGKYLSMAFDGPYQDAPKFLERLLAYAEQEKLSVGTIYFYYTTCPKCAKKYGHNYIVLFAEVLH
jgi:effector-binding domain-containing protein